MQKRRRVWNWTDKGGADTPPRPLKEGPGYSRQQVNQLGNRSDAQDMKELKEQKGPALVQAALPLVAA